MKTKAKSANKSTRRNKSPQQKGDSELSFKDLSLNQRKFLMAYAKTGNISTAALTSKVDRTCHYRWLREKFPGYAAAFATAEEIAVEGLESEARRRALKSSDVLLIFLLKAKRPQTYRDNPTVQLNQTVSANVGMVNQPTMTAEEFKKLPWTYRMKVLEAKTKGLPLPELPPPGTKVEDHAPFPSTRRITPEVVEPTQTAPVEVTPIVETVVEVETPNTTSTDKESKKDTSGTESRGPTSVSIRGASW